MSTTAEQGRPGDDNIITRKKHVKESLNVIKDKKERLRAALKAVSEAEEPDKEMMGKLLEAFDMMTAQENQYLAVLKNIVEIHEMAVEDVAKEVEEEKKEAPLEEATGEAKEPATQEELSELNETLRELQQVHAAAAAAAKLNERLVETLQLHKNKKNHLHELRKEKTAAMREKATDAMTEVEIAKMKLSAERGAMDRKEKQLDRLRKEALKRGIQLGANEQQLKEEMIKEAEKSGDRIPPLKSEEEKEEEEEVVEEKTEEQKMEERRKEIRENVRKEREKKEQINQQIRERLKAMEARKERVRQLRLLLTKASEEPESEEMAKKALDETFANAAANLANLTAMRERLEAMQESGTVTADDLPPEETDEIEEAVRTKFNVSMERTATNDQLNRIERLLLEQRQLLQKSDDKASVVSVVRQRLLLSSPLELRRLASVLHQLADGYAVPQLDSLLGDFFTESHYGHRKEVVKRNPSDEDEDEEEEEDSSLVFGNEQAFERNEAAHPDPMTQLMTEAKKELERASTIEEQTADRLRSLTTSFVSQLFPSVSSEVFDQQLGEQIHDCITQYVGIGVELCAENLLFDVAELLRNELSYFKLMNSVNRIQDSA